MKVLAACAAVSMTFFCATAFAYNAQSTASGAKFLNNGAGARAAALGDAFTAVSDDANGMYWNPAGITALRSPAISFTHSAWFGEINYEWLSYVQPTPYGNIGAALQYVDYGSLMETNTAGAELGTFNPHAMVAGLSYATTLYGIQAGATVKYVQSTIKHDASTIAYDLGLKYAFFRDHLLAGLALQNFGGGLTYVSREDPLPQNLKLGLGYRAPYDFLILADAVSPQNSGDTDYCVGIEKTFKLNRMQKRLPASGGKWGPTRYNTFAYRVGYNTKGLSGFEGISLGLGINYSIFSFDYAYVPYGDAGYAQKFTIGLNF
jgi:hypothetical protein